MQTGAEISECGLYRYTLYRIWDESKPFMVFIGLNPSTADAVKNDPTITRCIKRAHNGGFGGLYMLNLFAFRATKPKDMLNAKDPIGPDNDVWLDKIIQQAGLVVAAWGDDGNHMARSSVIIDRYQNLHCLLLNKSGEPRHPLYVPMSIQPKLLVEASENLGQNK